MHRTPFDSRSGRCLAGQLPGTPGFPASTWTVLASPAGTCWLIDRLNNISSTIWPVSEWHVCTWPQQPWQAVSWWTDCWAAWAAWWAAFWPPCLSPQLPSSVPWPAYLVVAHLKNQKACSWMITVSTVDSWHIRECISYLATDLKSQIFSSYVVNSQNFLGSFFVKVSLLGTSRGWIWGIAQRMTQSCPCLGLYPSEGRILLMWILQGYFKDTLNVDISIISVHCSVFGVQILDHYNLWSFAKLMQWLSLIPGIIISYTLDMIWIHSISQAGSTTWPCTWTAHNTWDAWIS